MRLPILAALVVLGTLGIATGAAAAVEEVYVQKVFQGGDKAIVVRRDGSAYLIEKGVGCLSLESFVGRRVVVSSPGLFLGVGSTLLITERNQSCRIWSSEPVGTAIFGGNSTVELPSAAETMTPGSAVADALQKILQRKRLEAQLQAALEREQQAAERRQQAALEREQQAAERRQQAALEREEVEAHLKAALASGLAPSRMTRPAFTPSPSSAVGTPGVAVEFYRNPGESSYQRFVPQGLTALGETTTTAGGTVYDKVRVTDDKGVERTGWVPRSTPSPSSAVGTPGVAVEFYPDSDFTSYERFRPRALTALGETVTARGKVFEKVRVIDGAGVERTGWVPRSTP